MRYLQLDEVLKIHERAVRQYGGSFELLNLGALESALAAPQQVIFDRELYPDLSSKASILFYLLIKNHPFVDGNKRTAFLCLMRFLQVNDGYLEATHDELFNLTLDVATSKLDKDRITGWIYTHMREK